MLPVINNIIVPGFVFPGVGLPELIIILVIVLLLFGPKKLPEMGKAIGQSIKELRKTSDSKEETPEDKKES